MGLFFLHFYASMIDTLPELIDYLDTRGAKYGIDGLDIYNSIPPTVREPELAYEFMQMKDISHKVPLSHGGDPAGDNWILEDSDVNRARGAQTMTPEEESTAMNDAQRDAQQLTRAAKIGAALAAGGAIAEPAVTFGLGAIGALVEATVIVPVLLTGAAVVGTAVAGVAIHRKARKEGWYDKLNDAIS